MLTLANILFGENGLPAITSIGLPEEAVLSTIFLILLLSTKEIISASKYYNEKVEHSFDIQIVSMLIMFFAIVIFKTMEVLYP